ncbi:MbnP family protein [Chitinophaga pinensis]|uniref:MbnP family protein n=1 Tax=Chitinophaga pinensis TaxID=79329 RepID=UPI001C99C70E|nr:MbnP family protein [Chitinophaga pinensis]
MKHINKCIATLALLSSVFTSCGKDNVAPVIDTNQKATLSIQFDNIVGDKNLQLNTGTYTNAAGEDFKVSLLRYFISNIK